jgi:hypothetical protein
MAASRKMTWVGWVLTVLPCLLFGLSAFFKIQGGPKMEKSLTHLGIPASMMMPLAILEITCMVIYLIPPTSVLGAILLTGYLGGAICTSWRVGDPFYPQIALGLVLWLGLYLREDRLRPLLPIRRT